MTEKFAHASGKRKNAVARTTVRSGTGRILINSKNLESLDNKIFKSKIRLPVILATDYVDDSKIDIIVKSNGGGVIGQADAISSSIAKALVEYTKEKELQGVYIKYDRTLIAGDHRQKEARKPSQSNKGARHKRQKSYR
ncbi:MAG: 30S ribosomal protein S9 [Candidatus Altiarchaeales archaeon]|nr:30S ribosomal protein S9 [Candidatus Altiarchaeales archaeon]